MHALLISQAIKESFLASTGQHVYCCSGLTFRQSALGPQVGHLRRCAGAMAEAVGSMHAFTATSGRGLAKF